MGGADRPRIVQDNKKIAHEEDKKAGMHASGKTVIGFRPSYAR